MNELPKDLMQCNIELKLQNDRLKKQINKLVEIAGDRVIPCPEEFGLPKLGTCQECEKCWRYAIEEMG